MKTPVKKIDDIVHKERIDRKRQKVMYTEQIRNLPDGVFVNIKEENYLLLKRKLYHWTPFGYDLCDTVLPSLTVQVLTPRSIVNTIKAGYVLQVDKSIEDL